MTKPTPFARALTCLAAWLIGCVAVISPCRAQAPWFVEEAQSRGLVFRHQTGHRDRHYMPEIACGGAALADLDNDGDLDAYLVQSGSIVDRSAPRPPNQLFLNRGDGTFDDATSGSGAELTNSAYGMGVACGDYDNDGDVDLYVTNVGPNVLLRNDGLVSGRLHFTDVTAAAAVGDSGWGTSAAFFDYDRDGDLDLFVVNYLVWSPATEIDCYNDMGGPDYCSPKNYSAPARSVLYRNNGDAAFTDVSLASGIAGAVGDGLGVTCADFDRNGWIDVFVANDGTPNHLWLNQGDGTFREEAMRLGCAVDREGKPKAGMGIAVADIDDDSDDDLLICNLNRESDSLFLNEGGWFNDRTARAGLALISRPFTRFGTGWFDFDSDGWLDLYVANGRVMRQATLYGEDPFAEPSLLFRGEAAESRGGKAWFTEVKPRGGTEPIRYGAGRAAAFGDIDNDGGVDILVINRDGPAHLLRNIAPQRGQWIGLRVLDEHGRDALNATVTLRLGERTLTRSIRAASSYMASNDPRLHAGLGAAGSVTDVQVRWLDGKTEQFGALPAGSYHTLRRGGGKP